VKTQIRPDGPVGQGLACENIAGVGDIVFNVSHTCSELKSPR
jgi:hypothetical protein